MKTLYPKIHYTLYIKSHVDGFSDYEDECFAISKLQAARIFLKKMDHPYFTENGETYNPAYDWDEKSLYPYIDDMTEMDKPLSNYEKEMMH